MYVCMVITYSRVWINRVRLPILLVVSWTGKMNIPLPPYVPENLVSRDGFSRPVPRQPAHLHTQAESGAYWRDSSRVPRRRPIMKVWINRVKGCQSCSWSAEQGKWTFPCPRSRLRIWSRETGPAVPSRASLLISILRLNLVLTCGIPPEFRGGVQLFTGVFKPPYAIGSVPSLSGHAIAYRWCSLLPRQVTLDRLICLSFPHPLLVWIGHVESTGDTTDWLQVPLQRWTITSIIIE